MATILLVEDHYMSRQLLRTLFESTGHRVLEAANGWTALTLARNNHLDLIITDILLPTMDGVVFAQRLREVSACDSIPIIFYTATCCLPEEISLGKGCGSCRVITKPSDPGAILDVVNEVLGIGGDPPPGSRQPPDSVFTLSTGLQLAVLMDMSHSLVALRDRQHLLRVVARAFREFLNCRHCLLGVMESAERKSYFLGRAEDEPYNSCPLGLYPPLEIKEQVLSKQMPKRWSSQGGDNPTNMLALPFATPSRVYGWICLKDKLDGEAFSSGDEEAAMTLSAQASLAYENLLLFDQLREKEKHLEQLVEERTAQLEKAKAELIKVQKLESLGVLAGGIAHNFNNALTAIMGHTQIAKMQVEPGEKVYRNLELAERACLDAQALTHQLLTFAKGGKPVRKVASLLETIRYTAELTLQNFSVECKCNLDPELSPAEVDLGQIGQVLSNLLINACQAMDEQGSICVSAVNLDIDAESPLPLPAGRYIKISVADQGVGIAAEDLDKIFDPYFTTKDGGNGLGLATAYSIIKNHEGHITVESEVGVGTCFHVFLPAALGQTQGLVKKCAPAAAAGRILIIEDNEHIAEALTEILNMHGYMAEWVGDGAEGLALYQEGMRREDKYRAVIMDLTIPGGMGGRETIKRMLELDPEVIALVISGYSNDPVMANYREYGFSGALSKPFSYDDLLVELQALLQ